MREIHFLFLTKLVPSSVAVTIQLQSILVYPFDRVPHDFSISLYSGLNLIMGVWERCLFGVSIPNNSRVVTILFGCHQFQVWNVDLGSLFTN